MGSLVFAAGLVLVVVSALATGIPFTPLGAAERVLLFLVGVLTLVLGYIMVRWARG